MIFALNVDICVRMPDVPNFFLEALAVIIAKIAISTYQKKAFGELYQPLPLSSTTLRVQCLRKLRPFKFFSYKFQLNENVKALCLYCTNLNGTNISVKVIQWGKLLYDFPVFTVSHYTEQAVSIKGLSSGIASS